MPKASEAEIMPEAPNVMLDVISKLRYQSQANGQD
jgi:hypothetical protein